MAERRVDVAPTRFGEETLETNKVLKNTYMLLGLTLAFSAVTAGVSMALNLPPMAGLGFTLVGLYVFPWYSYHAPPPQKTVLHS